MDFPWYKLYKDANDIRYCASWARPIMSRESTGNGGMSKAK